MKTRRARIGTENVLVEERPEIDHRLFLVISTVMLIDDLLVLLVILSLQLSWIVANIFLALNVLVFGFLFIFIHYRRVLLTDCKLLVQFGLFRSSVLLSSIRQVTVQGPPKWQMLGGLVSLFRDRLVYCFGSRSPFVKVERRSGVAKTLYFNVRNAPDFVRKLRQLAKVG
jgi:hypothetical protein